MDYVSKNAQKYILLPFYIQFPEFISPLKKLMNPEFRNSAFEGPCDESLENYREETRC